MSVKNHKVWKPWVHFIFHWILTDFSGQQRKKKNHVGISFFSSMREKKFHAENFLLKKKMFYLVLHRNLQVYHVENVSVRNQMNSFFHSVSLRFLQNPFCKLGSTKEKKLISLIFFNIMRTFLVEKQNFCQISGDIKISLFHTWKKSRGPTWPLRASVWRRGLRGRFWLRQIIMI